MRGGGGGRAGSTAAGSCPLTAPLRRMWTSTCSHCRRAMGSLLSASLTTASRSPRSPPGRRPKRAGTPRAGGTGSSTPGTGTAPGSRAPASLRGGPLAGTKASPRSKGEGRAGGSCPLRARPSSVPPGHFPPRPVRAGSAGGHQCICMLPRRASPHGPAAVHHSRPAPSGPLPGARPSPQPQGPRPPSVTGLSGAGGLAGTAEAAGKHFRPLPPRVLSPRESVKNTASGCSELRSWTWAPCWWGD